MAEVKIGKKYKLEKPQEETILYEKVEPHIARVILNRPEKHNAILTPEMFIELKNKMVMGVDDDDVKVIILKGNGPSFSSGDDQGRPPFEAYGGEPGVKPPQSVRITKMWQWVKAFNDATIYCPKIVIAQVQGWVIGMATQMVEACDLAIAGESLKYAHLEQRIGFAGMLPFPTLLHKLLTLGPKKTREQLLTSKVLTAQQALDWGLVNAVVPDDQLDEETLRWARGIAMHSTDGLIIGKMQYQLVMQNLGVGLMETANFPIHALFTNIKWREDELNYLKSRVTEGGLKQSFKAREGRWKEKSGF